MDQTNHNAQTDQDCEHDRHIDQHNNERIRRYRLSHSLSPRLLPHAGTPQWGFSFRDSSRDHRVLLSLTLFVSEHRISRSPELFRGYTCFFAKYTTRMSGSLLSLVGTVLNIFAKANSSRTQKKGYPIYERSVKHGTIFLLKEKMNEKSYHYGTLLINTKKEFIRDNQPLKGISSINIQIIFFICQIRPLFYSKTI